MIRLTLYGISGRAQATYDLKPGEQLDVEHRPVFTVTRIVAEPVYEQLDMESPVGVVVNGTLYWTDEEGVEHSGPFVGPMPPESDMTRTRGGAQSGL